MPKIDDDAISSHRDVLLVGYWTGQPFEFGDGDVWLPRAAIEARKDTARFLQETSRWWDWDPMSECWRLRREPITTSSYCVYNWADYKHG